MSRERDENPAIEYVEHRRNDDLLCNLYAITTMGKNVYVYHFKISPSDDDNEDLVERLITRYINC